MTRRMNRTSVILIAAGLGLLSSASSAFQESQGGVATEQQPAPAVSPSDAINPDLNLKDTGTSIGEAPSGIEVRIPGLGRLGVLPKFDFGLELLYGVNEPKGSEGERWRNEQPDDVQIRGALKHRF
jgi:hypothetical protein